jgi:hypothetical protein
MRRTTTILLTLMITLGAFALAPTANAAKAGGGSKPSGGGSSTLTLVLLDSTDGVAHYGQRITFKVSTSATSEPHVSVACVQNGSTVYTAQTGYYASYPWPGTQTMTLSSGAWTSGAADCTAKMYYFNGNKTVYATTLAFPVAA